MTQNLDFGVNSCSVIFLMCYVEGRWGSENFLAAPLLVNFLLQGKIKVWPWPTFPGTPLPEASSLGRGLRGRLHFWLPSSEPAPALQEAELNFGSRRERWGDWAPGPAALISVCTSWKPCHEENRQRVNSRRQPRQQGGPGWPENLSQLQVSARFWLSLLGAPVPLGLRPEASWDSTICPGKVRPGQGAGPGFRTAPLAMALPDQSLRDSWSIHSIPMGLQRMPGQVWGQEEMSATSSWPCPQPGVQQLLSPTLEDRSDFFFIPAAVGHSRAARPQPSGQANPVCSTQSHENYSSDKINMITSWGLQRMLLLWEEVRRGLRFINILLFKRGFLVVCKSLLAGETASLWPPGCSLEQGQSVQAA